MYFIKIHKERYLNHNTADKYINVWPDQKNVLSILFTMYLFGMNSKDNSPKVYKMHKKCHLNFTLQFN